MSTYDWIDNWLPTTLANLDIGLFHLRQVRVAPLHMEDIGWIVPNVGKDILYVQHRLSLSRE
jgi:hypothetical protein